MGKKIYSAVRDCDVIVLAIPLYYWNMSIRSRARLALLRGRGNSMPTGIYIAG